MSANLPFQRASISFMATYVVGEVDSGTNPSPCALTSILELKTQTLWF